MRLGRFVRARAEDSSPIRGFEVLICEDFYFPPVRVHGAALPAGQHGLGQIQLELEVCVSVVFLFLFVTAGFGVGAVDVEQRPWWQLNLPTDYIVELLGVA